MNLLKPIAPLLAIAMALPWLAGCETPAQTWWSPDGSRAAYLKLSDDGKSNRSLLIDDQGAIVKNLGPSMGGFAWSTDSKTLYFATTEKPGAESLALETRWIDAPLPAADTEDAEEQRKEMSLTLSAWTDGKVTPLFSMDFRAALTMALSPDGSWLAFVAETPKSDVLELYAYSLTSRKLYAIANGCGLAMCFRGPDRLAYVNSDRPGEAIDGVTGHVVEVKLDEAQQNLPRTVLLDVLPKDVPWLQPLGDALLLTSVVRTMPGKPGDTRDDMDALLRLAPDGAMSTLVSAVGPFFMPSPDGKRILFEKRTPANDPHDDDRQLAVMNADGSNMQILRDFRGYKSLPLYPAWHGNDEVSFIPADPSATADGHAFFDVALYRLTPKGGLDLVRTLSAKWDQALKPRD